MNYYAVLEQAIVFIEENLYNEIHIEDVAESTGYSHYHLSRLFHVVLGESLSNYIKKRRMAVSAKDLLYTEKRVLDLAMENGFQSSEAFSRAFKAIYGVSPAYYRSNQQDMFIGSKKVLKPELIRHIDKNITVKPKIVSMCEVNTAGFLQKINIKNNSLPELWNRLRKIQNQIPNVLSDNKGYGICDTKLSFYDEGKDVMFRYLVGVGVSSYDRLPENLARKTLKAGKYAVFTHTGSLSNISKTYDYIWGTWFLSTKEQLDSREDFELYDQRYLGFNHPDTEVDIYIPIRG